MSSLFAAFARRPQTISGLVKSHQRQAPLRFYQRWEERAPRLTNAAVGGFCGFLGDAIAQKMQHDERQSRKPAEEAEVETFRRKSFTRGASWQFDVERSVIFVIFNTLWTGGPLNSFIRYMDRSGLSLMKKMAVTHGLYNPMVYMPGYFFSIGMMKGESFQQSKEKFVKETPMALFNCCSFWAPVNVMQYSIVPAFLQVPFLSASLVVWSVILSSLGASKPQVIDKMEADRELTQADGMKPIGMDDALHFVENKVPFVKNALDALEDEVMAWKQREEDMLAIELLPSDPAAPTTFLNMMGFAPSSGRLAKLRPTNDEVILVKRSELLEDAMQFSAADGTSTAVIEEENWKSDDVTTGPTRLRPSSSKGEINRQQNRIVETQKIHHRLRAAVLINDAAAMSDDISTSDEVSTGSSYADVAGFAGQSASSSPQVRRKIGTQEEPASFPTAVPIEIISKGSSPHPTIGSMSTMDAMPCGKLTLEGLADDAFDIKAGALVAKGSFTERPGLDSVVWSTKHEESDNSSDISDEDEEETLPVFVAKEDANVTRSVNPDGIKLRRRCSR